MTNDRLAKYGWNWIQIFPSLPSAPQPLSPSAPPHRRTAALSFIRGQVSGGLGRAQSPTLAEIAPPAGWRHAARKHVLALWPRPG